MPPIQIPANFRPRSYQQPLWDYIAGGGKRAVAIYHRRAGKDYMGINLIADSMVKKTGVFWMVYPTYSQGKKICWNGRTNDGGSFLDAFPKELRESENSNEMIIKMKPFRPGEAGSIFQVVGADKPDSLVGTNPVGIVFSEFTLMSHEVWQLTQPILRANDGWALFIGTPKQQDWSYGLYCEAKKSKKWFCEMLTIKDTKKPDGSPVVSADEVQEDIDMGLISEEKARSEYYCSFENPVEGAYYGEIMAEIAPPDSDDPDDMTALQSHVRDVPWNPNKLVYTSWDIGYRDDTVIWFFQADEDRLNFIECVAFNKKDVAFYAKMLKERPYTYGKHFGPWDMKQEHMGVTVYRQFLDHDIQFKVLDKSPIQSGIEAVRAILRKCYFDQHKCAIGIQALREYRAEIDEKAQRLPGEEVYKDKPLHNWASHYADSFRYMAMGWRDSFLRKKKLRKDQMIKGDDFDPLG